MKAVASVFHSTLNV